MVYSHWQTNEYPTNEFQVHLITQKKPDSPIFSLSIFIVEIKQKTALPKNDISPKLRCEPVIVKKILEARYRSTYLVNMSSSIFGLTEIIITLYTTHSCMGLFKRSFPGKRAMPLHTLAYIPILMVCRVIWNMKYRCRFVPLLNDFK
jgi:hypothetical protein